MGVFKVGELNFFWRVFQSFALDEMRFALGTSLIAHGPPTLWTPIGAIHRLETLETDGA